MNNTSKEYAEERAKEYQSAFYEDHQCTGFKNGVSDYVEGYIDAVEQTGVKEMMEALDEVIKVWNEDGEDGEIQMNTPIAWYRVVRKAEKALSNFKD